MSTTTIRTFAGLVGIGVSNPSERLEVLGNVKTNSIRVGSNLNAFVPQGAIVMWSGTIGSIPTGWGLCDGTDTRPDLRDRFVIGYGTTYTTLGATGGTTTHSLQAASLPTHSHAGTTPSAYNHTHTTSIGQAGSHLHTASTGAAGSHFHPVSIQSSGLHAHPAGIQTYNSNHAHNIGNNGNGAHNHVSTDRILYHQNCQNTLRSSDWSPSEPQMYSQFEIFYNDGHSHNCNGWTQFAHSHPSSLTSTANHTHAHNLNSGGGHIHPHSLTQNDTHTHTVSIGTAGSHTHTGTTAQTGSAATFSTLPMYYALAFIIKL